MRTKNVLKNGIWGIVNQVISIMLGFIGRTIFIYFLSVEYLGISGLFTNILGVLSLSELGFSSAIAYHFYGMLVNKENDEITGVMCFYKKVYRVIAGVVLVMGLLVLPFLKYLVKDSIFSISYIQLVYVIYLMNTVLSYLFSYKYTLAIADQKQYLLTQIDTVFRIVLTIANAVLLILFRNYIVYLLVQMSMEVIKNFIKSKKVSKHYPYIDRRMEIEEQRKVAIITDTKNIFAGKLSSVIVSSTDNILISVFINITTVGIYSNYSMLIGYVQTFLMQFISATQVAIGNMMATETKEYSYGVLKKLTIIVYFATAFCSSCLFILLNLFIELWLGQDMVFSQSVTAWCVMVFYMQLMKLPLWFTLGGVGYFREDKNISLIEAATNLIFSIVLVKLFGLAGIFMGTVISAFIAWILKARLLFKKYYQQSAWEYVSLFAKLLGLNAFTIMVIKGMVGFVPMLNPYIKLFADLFLCVAIFAGINFILFRKSEAFAYMCGLGKQYLKRK